MPRGWMGLSGGVPSLSTLVCLSATFVLGVGWGRRRLWGAEKRFKRAFLLVSTLRLPPDQVEPFLDVLGRMAAYAALEERGTLSYEAARSTRDAGKLIVVERFVSEGYWKGIHQQSALYAELRRTLKHLGIGPEDAALEAFHEVDVGYV